MSDSGTTHLSDQHPGSGHDRGETDAGAFLHLATYIVGTFLFINVIGAIWVVVQAELHEEAQEYDLSAFNGMEALSGVNVMLAKWIPIVAIAGAIIIAIAYAYRRTRITGQRVERRRRR